MERTLLCEIVTPERVIYRNEVRMVVAPTIDGEIGVLPLHVPIVSPLVPGEIRVLLADKTTDWFAISGGYIQVYEDKVIVLADQAAAASQIDPATARQAAEEARRRVSEVEGGPDEEVDACIADLAWCEIQARAADKPRS